MPNRDLKAKTCACGLPGLWHAAEEGDPSVTGHIAFTRRESWEGHAVFENRMRRAAQRQGLRLVKSRRLDPKALDYGGHCLVDVRSSDLVAGGKFGVSLHDIARYLLGEVSE